MALCEGLCTKCPTIDFCFCGCTLRTGTLILAYIHVFGSAFGLVSVAILLSVLEKNDPNYNQVLVSLIFSTVVYSLHLLINILLLVGATRNKPGLVLPYLRGAGVLLCIGYVNVVLAFIANPVRHGIPATLGWLLAIYLFMVVNSFYQQLKKLNVRPDFE